MRVWTYALIAALAASLALSGCSAPPKDEPGTKSDASASGSGDMVSRAEDDKGTTKVVQDGDNFKVTHESKETGAVDKWEAGSSVDLSGMVTPQYPSAKKSDQPGARVEAEGRIQYLAIYSTNAKLDDLVSFYKGKMAKVDSEIKVGDGAMLNGEINGIKVGVTIAKAPEGDGLQISVVEDHPKK